MCGGIFIKSRAFDMDEQTSVYHSAYPFLDEAFDSRVSPPRSLWS